MAFFQIILWDICLFRFGSVWFVIHLARFQSLIHLFYYQWLLGVIRKNIDRKYFAVYIDWQRKMIVFYRTFTESSKYRRCANANQKHTHFQINLRLKPQKHINEWNLIDYDIK